MKFLGLILLLTTTVFARELPEEGIFAGRISKVHPDTGLVRIKVEFENQKYLNKNDSIEFLRGFTKQKSCEGFIKGKTADYILIRIPNYTECRDILFLGNGTYLQFYSEDLVNNLKMGKELMRIMMKKHLALSSRLNRTKKELEQYIEKINAINKRYQILREKLEHEWRDEIQALEEDQARTLSIYKDLQFRMDELNHKLEKYKIKEANLKMERWSLDPTEYFRK